MLALDETVGLEATQGAVHHHPARAGHGCEISSLGNWVRRVEDHLPVSRQDGSQTLARTLEGPFIEPHIQNDREIR